MRELEARLARLKGTEAACVFGSGYLANAGIIPALVGARRPGADRRAGACLPVGRRAAVARQACMPFRHNDVGHVARAAARSIARSIAHALIVTDGVFSMDGDLAPLAELAALASATTPG